jgi:hypothetical protein
MTKYYFRTPDDDLCYKLSYHLSYAKEEGLKEIELYEAIKEDVPGYFFCRDVDAPAEDGDCGKKCDGYTPKNGKSGMCRHRMNKFYAIGEKKIFNL